MTDQITWALRTWSVWPRGAATLPDGTYGVAETPAEYVVFRPKVYVETTIASYLKARPSRDPHKARMQLITQEWWMLSRWQFDVYWSRIVEEEIEQGDGEAARLRREALESFTWLDLEPPARALAEMLMESCRLPARAKPDAQHVAIAATQNLDFLLTWNCNHLVNPSLLPIMMDICISEGYNCPHILTPEQIMGVPIHEQRANR